MNKENVVNKYAQILFNSKIEENPTTCHYMDEPRRYCVKWKEKPSTEIMMIHESSDSRHWMHSSHRAESRMAIATSWGEGEMCNCTADRTLESPVS